jgi:hypothetical protein
VLLAVIGPGWLEAHDEKGNRRLNNPDDFVRIEIGTIIGFLSARARSRHYRKRRTHNEKINHRERDAYRRPRVSIGAAND